MVLSFLTVSSSKFGIKLQIEMFLFVVLNTGKVSQLNEPFAAFSTLVCPVLSFRLSPL